MGKFFKQLKVPIVAVWKLINPPYAFSWETLFLLSVFSCLMAAIATGIVKFGISLAGFVFLILGTAWFLIENPVKFFGLNLAHWIPGALISFLLFGYWLFVSPFWLMVSLPISAAMVAAAGEFVSPHLQLKKTDNSGYQRIIITSLSYLLISCWITFGFTLYRWFERYPSLTSLSEINSFKRSNFVIRVDVPEIVPTPPSGAIKLLTSGENLAKAAVHERSWSAIIQPWANTISQNPYLLDESLRAKQPASPESTLWQLEARIFRRDEGYDLFLLAIWKGPSTDPMGYYVTRTCQITQRLQQSAAPPTTNQQSTQAAPTEPSRLIETIGILSCPETSNPIPFSTPPRDRSNPV